VVIVIGDDGQIGPVVVNGKRNDTVQASIVTHSLWRKFKIYRFTKNLRLLGIENSLDLNNTEQREFLERQKQYAEVLSQIRLGDSFSLSVQEIVSYYDKGETLVRLPFSKYYTNFKDAMLFLFPQNFQTPALEQRAILCATNEDVDEWNARVQEMNPEPSVTLVAANQFKDVDDQNGILKSMLTDDACMFYSQNGVPEHRLILKKGDLCFVMRTLNRKEKLANNTRVRILEIRRFSIKVETVCEFPKEFIIPRIRFQVKLKFGGFVLIRTQFPLRLAYAMTKNKSQGQSIPFTLNDIRHNPFSHGHLYVSMSRATDADSTAFFCNEDQVFENGVVVANVVYQEMMLSDS
jgi:ATP-dependent exoDNAse (exonuclease V) alpha subunit